MTSRHEHIAQNLAAGRKWRFPEYVNMTKKELAEEAAILVKDGGWYENFPRLIELRDHMRLT